MNKKIRLGVIFGGRSAEHEVSIESAKSVLNALDREKYEIAPIGIDRKGVWHFYEPKACLPLFQKKALPTFEKDLSLLPTRAVQVFEKHLDVVFPVLHGPLGEDGTVQGLLKLFDVPFVGPGVLGSSVAMDKDVTKRLLEHAKVPVVPYVVLHEGDEVTWDYFPCFVKPANMGSSVGISKVHKKEELYDAVQEAFRFDRKAIVEEAIDGMEIECSVLGNEKPRASLPGRLISNHEFYSYEAKYLDPEGARYEVPAKLDPQIVTRVQELAVKASKVLCLEGMARVDFFVRGDEVFLNEVNTIPGFTNISLYPQMWAASGLAYPDLLDELIHLAIDRHTKETQLAIMR
ncbi:MAG: D-alanine--D-alanine ligase A [Chlamydiia bacterium]|nr:D-alanine--D-alanine ligase A [Chlamydiia bacterium]MCH9615484.1 D-alanine--D-alanine ligase A [Chlamydiia bacterium]MCH9629139.1 D-alanine--D-alanine ligase A [Chlamydiia bacterium]